MSEYETYETFETTNRYGEKIELAIVDRFNLEGRCFVVSALIAGDTVKDDALFVYEELGSGDEAEIVKIADPEEYARISEYYQNL